MSSQGGLKVRNISPLLQGLRNFLLGRKHVPERAALRYTPLVSARTQPDPILPDGEAHKLSANHYCKRDGRREAAPPVLIAENSASGPPKMIASGSDAKQSGARKGPPTPGKYWEWD